MSKQFSSTRGRHGFTLIEILVVIVIIIILIAILMPVETGGRRSAKSTVCLSNMKQVLMATSMYLNDSDGVYPQLRDADSNPAVGDASGSEDEPNLGSVFTLLKPYIKNGDLFTCPVDTDPFGKACLAENPDIPELASYLINGAFVFGLNESQVSSPASTILYAERRTGFCNDLFHPWFNASNPKAPEDEMDVLDGAIATDRHGVNSNYGFADGHVKRLVFSATYSSTINLYSP